MDNYILMDQKVIIIFLLSLISNSNQYKVFGIVNEGVVLKTMPSFTLYQKNDSIILFCYNFTNSKRDLKYKFVRLILFLLFIFVLILGRKRQTFFLQDFGMSRLLLMSRSWLVNGGFVVGISWGVGFY